MLIYRTAYVIVFVNRKLQPPLRRENCDDIFDELNIFSVSMLSKTSSTIISKPKIIIIGKQDLNSMPK